jgi:hypothetical protein
MPQIRTVNVEGKALKVLLVTDSHGQLGIIQTETGFAIIKRHEDNRWKIELHLSRAMTFALYDSLGMVSSVRSMLGTHHA